MIYLKNNLKLRLQNNKEKIENINHNFKDYKTQDN